MTSSAAKQRLRFYSKPTPAAVDILFKTYTCPTHRVMHFVSATTSRCYPGCWLPKAAPLGETPQR